MHFSAQKLMEEHRLPCVAPIEVGDDARRWVGVGGDGGFASRSPDRHQLRIDEYLRRSCHAQ